MVLYLHEENDGCISLRGQRSPDRRKREGMARGDRWQQVKLQKRRDEIKTKCAQGGKIFSDMMDSAIGGQEVRK